MAQVSPAAPEGPGHAHARATPGLHERRLRHDGLERRYLTYIPQSYTGAPMPLVVALHGGGGDPAFMADDARYGLLSKAEEAGFVVLFPGGYSRLPGGRLATWNAGECCGNARDRQVDDVGFVRAVVARVTAELHIDPQRIYATGMSNGAMLSHRLACEASDLFAAIAAVAGTDNTRRCQPARPVAILTLHARDDDHVLFDGGAGPAAFRDRSAVAPFTSVAETQRRWAERNQCTGEPVATLTRDGVRCERYSQCAAGVQVELCATERGGHSWPGASKTRRGKAPASQALSANDHMWEFFKANAR